MDATKPIYLQIQDLQNMWREVWWSMADGIPSEYERIKRIDIFEYWKLFDLWKDAVNREREQQKKQQNVKR